MDYLINSHGWFTAIGGFIVATILFIWRVSRWTNRMENLEKQTAESINSLVEKVDSSIEKNKDKWAVFENKGLEQRVTKLESIVTDVRDALAQQNSRDEALAKQNIELLVQITSLTEKIASLTSSVEDLKQPIGRNR